MKEREKNKEKDKDTLLNLYNQTWQLYIHEDQLSETRNSKFLSLVTAIFGVIGAILSLSIPFIFIESLKSKLFDLGIKLGIFFEFLFLILL